MPTTSRRNRAIALASSVQLTQPITPSAGLTSVLAGTRSLSRQQRRIRERVYTRTGSIEGSRLLHEFATLSIGQMHAQTQSVYLTTVRRLNAVTGSASLDDETAKDMVDWTIAQKEMLRRHLAGNLEGSVNRIVGVAHKELDEAEPEGFLARLFGG